LAILVLLNNLLHDLGAAGWIFGAVLLFSIMRKTNPAADATGIVTDTLKTVLMLMRISFAGIVVFGVLRLLAYRKYELNEAAGQDQVSLLIVKHIVFALIFLLGLVYYLRATKFIREARDERSE